MRTKVFPAVYLPALDETQEKDVSCNYMVARETVYRSYLKHWLKHEAPYKFVQDYTKESRPIMAPHDLCSIYKDFSSVQGTTPKITCQTLSAAENYFECFLKIKVFR